MKNYSEYQFSFFRILFGIYLTVHFLDLIPYGGEIFSREGTLRDPSLNFFHGLFPNALLLFDTPSGVTWFLAGLVVLSLFYALGLKRKLVSFFLWYGLACLFNRNNLISNPSLPYLGWLLLASTIIPSGERLSFDGLLRKKKTAVWSMPPLIFTGAWILLALGYSISGIAKLQSPSWVNGTAMTHLLENPLARDYFLREWFLALPPLFLIIMTWTSLALEVLFAPLCLWKPTRILVWTGIMGMHLGIVLLVNFTDLTLGMFMIHLFTFDPRWLSPESRKGELPIVFFDGVCGFCDHAIQFFMSQDEEHVLRYSPLQGETIKKYIQGPMAMNSMIYWDEKGKHFESEAALLILSRIGGFWKAIAWILFLIPSFIRNAIYQWIAANRYRFFGKKDVCRVPTPEEKSRFLN